MTYKYDIFVSYRRTDLVGRWVRNHFVPELQLRLDANAGAPMRIFCDFKLAEGANWAASLKNELRDSKLLLPVWSADYFRSEWCMAEWGSFRERERVLGLWGAADPEGLVYPVRFADGQYFHQDAQATQCSFDFSKLSYPDDVFRQSVKWLDFVGLVNDVACDLIQRLEHVPAWQEFPIVEPRPLPPVQMARPRL